MKKSTLPAVLSILTIVFCSTKTDDNPFSILKNEPLLQAYVQFQKLEKEKPSILEEQHYYQAKATLLSYGGRYDLAQTTYGKSDSLKDQKREINWELVNTTAGMDADSALLAMADDYRVIAFNEEHHLPHNRAIVYHYLERLYEKGYTYLALEGLNNYEYEDQELTDRGYPIEKKTGVYIDEPLFGNLIRQALKIGYQLIPYDYYGNEKSREVMQAENIFNQFKDGKLLVLGGYAHIRESKKLMGSYLKQLLNEDILTVKLTNSLSYQPHPNLLHQQPVLFPYIEDYGFDYQYVIPLSYQQSDTSNLPNWYTHYLHPKLHEVNLSEFPQDKDELTVPYLVRVLNTDEENGVSVYQYLETGVSKSKIMIPLQHEGEYEIQLIDEKHTSSIRRKI